MESGLKKLERAFESGALLRPSASEPNFLDLVRALAALCGVEGIQAGPGITKLSQRIGPGGPFALILVDGLGQALLERLPEESFLKKSWHGSLQTVFPSTTATALTTLATGEWPSQHGIPGWWTYLEEHRISTVTVRFQGRFTGKPLEQFGLTPENVFPLKSFWPRIPGQSLSILPAPIAQTPYSRYVSGGGARVGFHDIEEAASILRETLLKSGPPGLTFLYLPQLDSLSHRLGPDDPRVLDLLLSLDRALKATVESLTGKARIIITADHGQIKVPREHRFLLKKLDPLLRLLATYPTGEPIVPVFHVRPGQEDRFRAMFVERFGEFFALITPDEAEAQRFFGPIELSTPMKKRLGTFLGLALQPAALCSGPPAESGYGNNGFHGGLSRDEMRVPLILCP